MKKDPKIIDNWVDIYCEDWEKLGNPVIERTTMTTEEFNQGLIAMISTTNQRTEWMEIFQSTGNEWGYPEVKISPLSTEAQNEAIYKMMFNIPDEEVDVIIPSISNRMSLAS